MAMRLISPHTARKAIQYLNPKYVVAMTLGDTGEILHSRVRALGWG